MKFNKNDIIIPSAAVYPSGAMTVDGYEGDGTLLTHPLGGGLQYRFKPEAEMEFRVVPKVESNSTLWRRSKFSIEGVDAEFNGWTNGRRWNGWEMPYFEFSVAQRVIEMVTDTKGSYDEDRDCFISINSDEEEEAWETRTLNISGGSAVKVYGIGAGAWIWDECGR